jgi:hypothetical protein
LSCVDVPVVVLVLQGVRAALQTGGGAPLVADHPYDLGLCANLHDILGDSAPEWMLPPCKATEGGTRFRTAWDDRLLGLG